MQLAPQETHVFFFSKGKGVQDFLDFDVPNVFPPSAHKVVDCPCLDQVFNVF